MRAKAPAKYAYMIEDLFETITLYDNKVIAAEFSDYTKRSFEDGTATFEQLMGSKSLEQAMDIQTKFVKRSYDEYMHQMAKIGSMYAEFAKGMYKPMEKMMQGQR